jgi:hypothetical protein
MMTSRSLICLLENQNGGKLQKKNFKPLDSFHQGTSLEPKLKKNIYFCIGR